MVKENLDESTVSGDKEESNVLPSCNVPFLLLSTVVKEEKWFKILISN